MIGEGGVGSTAALTRKRLHRRLVRIAVEGLKNTSGPGVVRSWNNAVGVFHSVEALAITLAA